MTFGQTIRAVRKYRKLTITELSKKSEVSVTTISTIENDKHKPSVLVVSKLSKALELDFAELYKLV